MNSMETTKDVPGEGAKDLDEVVCFTEGDLTDAGNTGRPPPASFRLSFRDSYKVVDTEEGGRTSKYQGDGKDDVLDSHTGSGGTRTKMDHVRTSGHDVISRSSDILIQTAPSPSHCDQEEKGVYKEGPDQRLRILARNTDLNPAHTDHGLQHDTQSIGSTPPLSTGSLDISPSNPEPLMTSEGTPGSPTSEGGKSHFQEDRPKFPEGIESEESGTLSVSPCGCQRRKGKGLLHPL